MLDINMNSMFKKQTFQFYLDAYLYDTIRSSEKKVALSGNSVSVQLKHSIWIIIWRVDEGMRYSYGIMDERKILLYNPELFLKGNDILIFPSKDFHKWHGDIKEYIDFLYQINSINLEKGNPSTY